MVWIQLSKTFSFVDPVRNTLFRKIKGRLNHTSDLHEQIEKQVENLLGALYNLFRTQRSYKDQWKPKSSTH